MIELRTQGGFIMIIGIPKEIKKRRIPDRSHSLRRQRTQNSGHVILIETGAGSGSGFSDNEFLQADADVHGQKNSL